MFNKRPHCAENGNRSNLKLEENKSVLYIINSLNKDYVKIIIDSCDVTEGIKCDFGIHLVDKDRNLLVELKGSDISHAYDQLEKTLGIYNLKNCNKTSCFVVTSNNPLSATTSQILKMKFRKHNGVELVIVKSGYEYQYS